MAKSINNLAVLYNNQGKYSKAEILYKQALELRKNLLGEDHPDIAESLNNLAYLYHTQGRYLEGETLYLQALELFKNLLGEDHPNTQIVKQNYELMKREISNPWKRLWKRLFS